MALGVVTGLDSSFAKCRDNRSDPPTSPPRHPLFRQPWNNPYVPAGIFDWATDDTHNYPNDPDNTPICTLWLWRTRDADDQTLPGKVYTTNDSTKQLAHHPATDHDSTTKLKRNIKASLTTATQSPHEYRLSTTYTTPRQPQSNSPNLPASTDHNTVDQHSNNTIPSRPPATPRTKHTQQNDDTVYRTVQTPSRRHSTPQQPPRPSAINHQQRQLTTIPNEWVSVARYRAL